ncbi:MAG: ABC transporter permease, partial [Rhodanobacter sp.]
MRTSNMQLRPILSTLRRHKLTASLLVLQAAITCAIVCNVAFMIANRVQRINVPTGMAENELSVIQSKAIEKEGNPHAQHTADLVTLRGIPGVQSAVAVSYSMPLGQDESSSGICPSKQALDRAIQNNSIEGSGCVEPAVYDGTPGLIKTLGLHLVAGRDFQPEDYVSEGKPAVAIITRALAQHLYPGKQALG